MFEIDPTLVKDTWYLGDFPLCALLLSRDANYPWFILVPRVADCTEIHQLDVSQRAALLDESCVLAQTLEQIFDADKLNVAALGNVVAQLHVHHIVRYTDDPAWPAPVWGAMPHLEYDENTLLDRLNRILPALENSSFVARDWRNA